MQPVQAGIRRRAGRFASACRWLNQPSAQCGQFQDEPSDSAQSPKEFFHGDSADSLAAATLVA